MNKIKPVMIELFSGCGIISEVFRKRGFKTLTIDSNPDLKPDICTDILKLNISDLPTEFRNPGVIWASPPCQAFSVCTISKNWRNNKPISEKARLGLALLEKTKSLINELNPEFYFIENPRGMMRKQNINARRVSITYCKYGEKYQKPTDIFTNSNWIGRKPCKAGDHCHEYQPRSYKRKVGYGVLGLGVQGLSNAFERGKIPLELCEEIADFCQGNIKQARLNENGVM